MYNVDYVITYLDPTDPYWLEQFKPYMEIEFASQKSRYDDDGVKHFKYTLRSIAKNMPWINKLHLVVFSESQVPKWLNRDTVNIVTDNMYIPDKYLPTFNTSTKQMHLQFIPGLEEHFIFGDDDQFVLNEVFLNEFYDLNGNPLSERIRTRRVIKDSQENWESIVYNSTKFAFIATNTSFDPLNLQTQPAFHMPHPVLKSDLIDLYNKNVELIDKSITPCRNRRNIIGFAWCVSNGLKYNNFIHLNTFQICGSNMDDEHDINEYKNNGVQILNININNKGDYYQKQLQQIFPDKCKYEV